MYYVYIYIYRERETERDIISHIVYTIYYVLYDMYSILYTMRRQPHGRLPQRRAGD